MKLSYPKGMARPPSVRIHFAVSASQQAVIDFSHARSRAPRSGFSRVLAAGVAAPSFRFATVFRITLLALAAEHRPRFYTTDGSGTCVAQEQQCSNDSKGNMFFRRSTACVWFGRYVQDVYQGLGCATLADASSIVASLTSVVLFTGCFRVLGVLGV